MKHLFIIFALALFAIAGCQHKVRVEDQNINLKPGQAELRFGPGHKRYEINNRSGKRLLNIDVYEDDRNINIKRDQQDIEIRRPNR